MRFPVHIVLAAAGLVILMASTITSMCMGAFAIPVEWIPAMLLGQATEDQAMASQVLWAIRLPRIVLGVFLGGALGFSSMLDGGGCEAHEGPE